MSDSPKSWLRAEVLAPLILQVALAGVGGLIYVVVANGKSDTNADNVKRIEQAVHDLSIKLELLPGQAQRIVGLEQWEAHADGMFGALDGRLRTVENSTERNTADISNITRASGVHTR